jgi:hypothetical protein
LASTPDAGSANPLFHQGALARRGEPGGPIALLADGVSSFITEQVFTQDGGDRNLARAQTSLLLISA